MQVKDRMLHMKEQGTKLEGLASLDTFDKGKLSMRHFL